MEYIQTENKIILSAPAKINLFLAITGKRTDGFHNISSVISKIALSDQVTIEKTFNTDETTCICSNNESLSGKGNLAFQTVLKWREQTSIRSGIKVFIKKNIPLMGGLGGGSSDAIATLIGLNYLFDNLISEKKLMYMSQAIGSDCPFFTSSGLAQVSGRGEIIRNLSADKKKSLNGRKLILIQPPMGFSTEVLYKDFSANEKYSNKNWAEEHISFWEKNEISFEDLLFNDFEKVILKKYLFLNPLFRELRNIFGLNFHISGSGSCFYSFLDESTHEELVKDHAARVLGPNFKFWITQISY